MSVEVGLGREALNKSIRVATENLVAGCAFLTTLAIIFNGYNEVSPDKVGDQLLECSPQIIDFEMNHLKGRYKIQALADIGIRRITLVIPSEDYRATGDKYIEKSLEKFPIYKDIPSVDMQIGSRRNRSVEIADYTDCAVNVYYDPTNITR